MNVQILNDSNGKPEFLVLPIREIKLDSEHIEREIVEAVEDVLDNLYADLAESESSVEFELGQYINNPVKRMRIEAGLTQKELAAHLRCSQANISQIEKMAKVGEETITRVKSVISDP